MTLNDRAVVPDAWNGPPFDAGLVRDELLHELFEAAVDRAPGRTAVIAGESRLSYRELEERANRLARRLRRLGAGPEERVAILLPRGERLYEAMLATLKAGAAYLPIDPDTPAKRAAFMIEDARAKCLLTLAGDLGRGLPEGIPRLRLDGDADGIASESSARLTRADTGARPENICYVIYTSGTTGRPKGTLIEHRNATNLVRAEARLYGLNADDRIFQLASAAFDASIEEIWMAFFHGAALVAGRREDIRPGPEFSQGLARQGVTVLSCVPTFLAMVEKDIPTLRVLILGGETCPPSVPQRWHRPGRAIFNTYGPTEATVVATAAALAPGRPVTIGRPLTNYRVFLLDGDLRPVPPGAPGEICIAGAGVARGYLNRPTQQDEKFLVTDALTGSPLRLYRTADLGRFTPEGEIEHLGRSDDQIKVRGYRVELSEIEAALTECPGVLAAAVALHQQTQRLAAYVVPKAGKRLDREGLRCSLTQRLPPYMMPAFLDELAALPLTATGKIDRRGLPAPRPPLQSPAQAPRTPPRDDAERVVAGVWEEVLGRDGVSMDDDFFLDLNGHSLLAAMAVSKLRGRPGFASVSIGDLYAHPTAEQLARLARAGSAAPAARPFHDTPRRTFLACAAGQALGILFLAGIYAWEWLGPFLAYGYLIVADWPIHKALLAAMLVYFLTIPFMLGLSITLKWLLLGRIRPGAHPLWGWYYWRFWLVRAVTRIAPVHYLDGTPFINAYFRLMGARIGRDVYIGSHSLATFDLLTVGDGSSIGMDVSFDGTAVEDGLLRLSPVTIGAGCFVGNRCSLGAGAALEDGAGLEDLSMVPDGACVPAGELWQGSPAATAGRLPAETPRPPWGLAASASQLVSVFLFPLVVLGATLPGLMAIAHLGHMDSGFAFLLVSPLLALSFVAVLYGALWTFKWLLIGRLRPGRFPLDGLFYVRKWFFDQLMTISFEVTETIYETLYIRPWLKAMGARIGRRSEMAALGFLHPDLLVLDEESMIADLVFMGAPRVRNGWQTIGEVRVGKRVFVGNSAVLPPGTALGSGVLIGALSTPPLQASGPVPEATSWFGSPPIHLPARYHSDKFSEAQTYRPPRRLVALRLFIEFFRVILPSTLFIVLASLLMNATDILQDYIGFKEWLLTLPFLYVAAGILALLMTLGLKKLLIGRYRPGERPFWCDFVWRTDLVTGVYDNLCGFFFLDLLRGTPFITWALRAFGLKIGKRCYIDTTWFTEFDLVELGDEVALNENANLQTHLFEDRVIKMGRVRVGDRCVVGTMTTVLYDTTLEAGASLGDLSLLMKGESLPARTRWYGIPAQPEAAAGPSLSEMAHHQV